MGGSIATTRQTTPFSYRIGSYKGFANEKGAANGGDRQRHWPGWELDVPGDAGAGTTGRRPDPNWPWPFVAPRRRVAGETTDRIAHVAEPPLLDNGDRPLSNGLSCKKTRNRALTTPLLQCACCDHFSLDDGDWEICPVCFWEDDGLGICKPDEESGANHITLRQARANFAFFGACDRRMLPNVITVKERRRYAVQPRDLV